MQLTDSTDQLPQNILHSFYYLHLQNLGQTVTMSRSWAGTQNSQAHQVSIWKKTCNYHTNTSESFMLILWGSPYWQAAC